MLKPRRLEKGRRSVGEFFRNYSLESGSEADYPLIMCHHDTPLS